MGVATVEHPDLSIGRRFGDSVPIVMKEHTLLSCVSPEPNPVRSPTQFQLQHCIVSVHWLYFHTTFHVVLQPSEVTPGGVFIFVVLEVTYEAMLSVLEELSFKCPKLRQKSKYKSLEGTKDK